MIDRVAAYLDKNHYEEHLKMHQVPETYLKPQYNLAKGQFATIVRMQAGRLQLERVQWGSQLGSQSFDPADREADQKTVTKVERAVFPINGFFIWNDDREDTQPFYIKRIDGRPLYVPSLIKTESTGDRHFEILEREANILILPLTKQMPRAVHKDNIKDWLDMSLSEKEALEHSEMELGLTELTVHKVSGAVNDPARNEEGLLHPLPK